MAWGRQARYCCNNTADGCVLARSDALFSQQQFATWGGVCRGDDRQPGCGRPLVPGRPADRRPRLLTGALLVLALVASTALALRTYVFPPPLDSIGFAAGQSRVDETAGQLVVQLQRQAPTNAAARLQLQFVDGSAKAGEDYQAPGQVIVMQAGQSQASIVIPVLPDKTLRKAERHFTVVLDNVLGRPTHTVFIAPRAVEIGAQALVEQSVLGASRLAADIAGLVVKTEAMGNILSNFRGRDVEFQEFRQQLKDTGDNLVRAREAYLQAVRGLQAQPARQVLVAMDKLAAELKQSDFRQQAAVMPVLGRQYEEVVNGKSVDMDRWVRELGATVPRLPGRNPRSPTV